MVHVVCAACLMKEIRIAPGRAAHKKIDVRSVLILDGGCNGGTRSGCICSEKEAEQQQMDSKLLNSPGCGGGHQVKHKNVRPSRCTAV